MLDSGPQEELSMGRAEKCTMDYEGMIKRASEKLARAKPFRDAALAYYIGRRAYDDMASLIGELVTKCNMLEHEIEILIAAQEAEK